MDIFPSTLIEHPILRSLPLAGRAVTFQPLMRPVWVTVLVHGAFTVWVTFLPVSVL